MITIAICNACFAFIFVIYAGFDLAHACYKVITLFVVNQVLMECLRFYSFGFSSIIQGKKGQLS